VLNRLGGWTRAVRAAGMTPLASPASVRRRRWTESACWSALRRVVDELGEIPTVLSYERHAAGRHDLPSSATLRNRLGRWSSISAQLAVERELALHVQTAVVPTGPAAIAVAVQPAQPSAAAREARALQPAQPSAAAPEARI
jgi:hypothetical protein